VGKLLYLFHFSYSTVSLVHLISTMAVCRGIT